MSHFVKAVCWKFHPVLEMSVIPIILVDSKYMFTNTFEDHGGGGSWYKGLSRDVLLKWVAKSASWYNNDPLFSARTGINMGHIFKIGAKIGPISSI